MSRFAFYWPDNSSYLSAGLRELVSRGHSVSLTVLSEGRYAATDIADAGVEVTRLFPGERRSAPDADCLVVCGWHVPAFRKVVRTFDAGPRVLFFDTQWTGSARQVIRQPAARAWLPRAFDYAFVPGYRQSVTARKLGFTQDRIRWGSLTLDAARFSEIPVLTPATAAGRRRFLFAGRDVPAKGIDVLLRAYAEYARFVADPFELLLAGPAPDSAAGSAPGVRALGFVQPDRLAAAMGESSAFVLPSVFEPYGVVLQEAAAAGLPLVASDACGAVEQVLEPGWNGHLVGAGSVDQLTDALGMLHRTPVETLCAMGQRSRVRSEAHYPQRWASSLETCL